MAVSNQYDYIIVGAGVAGLQLALAFLEDSFFLNKRILIIDPDQKKTNDKTFSFWEKGIGKWDDIVHRKWESARCISPTNEELTFDLLPYEYKTIKSIDFYSMALHKIKNTPNISIVQDKVTEVCNHGSRVLVKIDKTAFEASRVFDSRITVSLKEIKETSTYVNQSFLGYEVEFEQDVFNEEQCTMMDYSHQWEGSTSFVYILPFSKRKALVEYTFFASFTPEKSVFKNQLESYLEKGYTNMSYTIHSIEYGEIPMTDYNFSEQQQQHIIKIGTAAGWVKPSSGYAFKATEAYVSRILDGLKKDRVYLAKPRRYHFYDRLLLKILKYDNKIGGKLFFEMYKRPQISLLFKFLDEKTSFFEDVKLILQLPYLPFLRALFRKK